MTFHRGDQGPDPSCKGASILRCCAQKYKVSACSHAFGRRSILRVTALAIPKNISLRDTPKDTLTDLNKTFSGSRLGKLLTIIVKMAGAWRLELQTYGFGDRRSTN